MLPFIEKYYTDVSTEQFDSVYLLVIDSKLGSDEKKAQIRAAMEKNKVPINACINHASGGKWSFLDAAGHFRCEPMMELIVEGAKSVDTFGVDLMAEAVWSEKCIRKLLDKGYPIMDIQSYTDGDNYDGMRVLQRCAEAGSIGAISVLAANGLDLNRNISSYGIPTPALVHAARYGKESIVEGLLRAGADQTVTASGGETYLHASVRLSSATATELYDRPENVDKLGHTLLVANELGLDVNLRDKKGQTPLHLAAKLGYRNKVALLLECGADASLRDASKKTPLMVARASKRDEAVKTLLSWNARQAVRKAIASATSSGLRVS